MRSDFWIESQNNSSTTALAADATFTGVGEENAFPQIGVSCQSDVSGTLYFDFSVDGTNWGTFPVAGHKIKAGIHAAHSAEKWGRFCRVRLVNNSTIQGYLRLKTYYGNFSQLSAPLSQSQTLGADARMMRSIPSDMDLDLGGFSDVQSKTKFGIVEDLDGADSNRDVWAYGGDNVGGDVKTFPASSSTFYMASSSASDTSKEVTIDGIAADGTQTTVVATLNGQTPVSLGTLLDVNSASFTGSDQTGIGNVGFVVANNFTNGVPDDSTEVVAFIPAGFNQTQLCMYRTPTDTRIRIQKIYIAIARANGSLGSADVNFRVKEPGGSWRVVRPYFVTTAYPIDVDQQGLVFAGGTQIAIRVTAVSDADTNINAQFKFQLIDN